MQKGMHCIGVCIGVGAKMQLEGYLTVDEAAKRLGISRDTVRRRIKRGELRAEKRKGPYGECWMIPESEIKTAQVITDVIPVTRQVSMPDLVTAITAKVTEALTKELAGTRAAIEDLTEKESRTRAEIEALREELAATREAQERIEKSIEERDRRLTEALRSLTERKKRRPWWRRLFLRPK